MQLFSRSKRSVQSRRATRRSFFQLERLENRDYMAADLYVVTNDDLWGGDVTPGDRDVAVAEIRMLGRGTMPTSLMFQSEIGAEMRNLVTQPELYADLYKVDARGRRTLGQDDRFETLIARGSFNPEGDVLFRFGGIGTVMAQLGVPLQMQVDIKPDAEDAMPIQFSEPTVGFLNNRRTNVFQIGGDNPLYVVDTVKDVSLHIDFSFSAESIGPGDDDIVMGILTFNADEPVYVDRFYVGVEGRRADNSLIPDVDDVVEDIELRDPLTGRVYYGTPVAEFAGIEVVRFDGIYVDGSVNLEVQLDQEGTVAAGDKFRVHAVTEAFGSGRNVNIAGLTGLTDDFHVQACADDWNDRLTVAPGGVLSGMFRKIEIPQLNVAVKSIGTTDTAVRNEDNINLLRMEVLADGEDLLFTQSTFYAAMGSILNGQNFTLWADTDRDPDRKVDTILQSGVATRDGRTVSFDSIIGGGFVIPEGESIVLEVHMDVASGLMPNPTLQLGLLAPSVQAEELDNGSSLAPSQIVVTAVPSKTWNFVPQGDLFVTLDSTPVRSRQLLGGTLGDTVFRIQFRAQHESADVTDLQFTTRGSMGSSIDRLELYRDGATTAFATATVSGCGSDQVIRTDNGISVQTFCMNAENGQLVIPDGENVDVLVRPRMKSDEQGALSGESFQLFLGAAAVSDNSTGQGAVRARGYQSSNNLVANDGDALAEGEVFIGVDIAAPNREIVSNRHTVVLSKVTSVTNANPDADNTNVPTGISPVGQFKFTAATNANTLNGINKFELVKPVYAVAGTNESVNVDLLRYYNKADSTVYASAVAIDGNGNILHGNVVGSFRVYVNLRGTQIDRFVESGQSETFVLAPSITNPKINASQTSSLQISLLVDETQWADPDIEALDAVFTGLGLSDTVIRSTAYKS